MRDFQKIARERIDVLIKQADNMFHLNPQLSNRYIYLLRKIAMKYNVKIKPEYKRKFCKHCYSYLRPSVNVRIRVSNGKVVYYCLNCKKFMRFPYIKEQKEKRRLKLSKNV